MKANSCILNAHIEPVDLNFVLRQKLCFSRRRSLGVDVGAVSTLTAILTRYQAGVIIILVCSECLVFTRFVCLGGRR